MVAAGSSEAAQALVGKTVAIAGGAMYSQYRAVDASACLVLPEGATARDGASSFVNPMTALGMTETMRREGHWGLVHTAAASNLGQMLVKLCQKDGIPLVNIVRKPEQEELLQVAGRNPCPQLDITVVRDRPRRGSQSDIRDARFRRHGRWNAGQPDPQRHGTGGHCDRGAVLTLRVERPQAGVHLRRTRHQSDGAHQEFRHGVGRGRVAAHPISSERGAPRLSVGCALGWPRNSPRRSRAATPGRFHSPACSIPMRSTNTSSERPERSSS